MADEDRQQRIDLMKSIYHLVDTTMYHAYTAGMPMKTTAVVVVDVSDDLGAAFCKLALREDIEKIKAEALNAGASRPLGLFALNISLLSALLKAGGDIENGDGILEPPPSADMVRTLMVAFGGLTRGYVELRLPSACSG